MNLAIVTTHPIQYQVPWFRLLSEQPEVELTVFFAMVPDAEQQGAGFGVAFQWDLPLLEGYRHEVLENRSEHPAVTRFRGCDTPGILRRLREGAFDAVIVNGWGTKTGLQTLWACKRLRIPCVVRGEANGFRPRAKWKRLGHRLLLSQYAALLSIGKANRDYYRSLGVPNARIFDTPYCVDNAFFAERAEAARADRAGLRARWGLPTEAAVFLFVGKFETKKHPLFLVELFREVPEGAWLLMAGSGALFEEARSRAEAEELPIRFTGFLNQGELPSAYAAADALLLPSDHGETWGLVVNEAMAGGLPALVSDQVGCHPDLITPGETGAVAPLDDTAVWRRLIAEWTRDPALLRRMGEQARERVRGYGFKQVVNGVLAACGWIRRKLKY
jgi:glycosyltransferase involved in cell wall biosynthesis